VRRQIRKQRAQQATINLRFSPLAPYSPGLVGIRGHARASVWRKAQSRGETLYSRARGWRMSMSLRAWLPRGIAHRAAVCQADIGVTIFSTACSYRWSKRALGEPGESLRNLAGHIRARCSLPRTQKVIRAAKLLIKRKMDIAPHAVISMFIPESRSTKHGDCVMWLNNVG